MSFKLPLVSNVPEESGTSKRWCEVGSTRLNDMLFEEPVLAENDITSPRDTIPALTFSSTNGLALYDIVDWLVSVPASMMTILPPRTVKLDTVKLAPVIPGKPETPEKVTCIPIPKKVWSTPAISTCAGLLVVMFTTAAAWAATV